MRRTRSKRSPPTADAGDAVMAEVGNLLFARGAAEWDVTLPGRGFAGKVAAGFKRKMSGGAVVMTTCAGPGLFRH